MTPDANALDVKRLREIAGKATPGPWVDNGPHEPSRADHGWRSVAGSSIVCVDSHTAFASGRGRYEREAEFIAAFNPSTALALLSRLAALEALVVKLRESGAHFEMAADVAKSRVLALEAENAKLRAVAEAVPAVIAEADRETVSFQTLRRALAALEARKESQ